VNVEDKQHQHFVRQESINGSQAEENSPPHSQSRGELPTHERESHSSSSHEHHRPHSAHAEATTSTTTTTSMIPASINYNVNIQFDPATPQSGKPTNLSLMVTEQKVGEPIKDFDIIHDKLICT
jgi:hypothetical protein